MRTIALLLLIANACLLAYSFIAQSGESNNPLLEPVRPERIRALTAQQVAALGPSKVAQLNLNCAEWGPFTERERTMVSEILTPLLLGKTLVTQRAEISPAYWVSVPPKTGKGGVERTLKDLESAGFADATAVKEGEKNVISAGVFRSETAAIAQRDAIEAKSVKGARVLQRDTPVNGTLFIVREPAQAAVAAMEAAKAKFPDAPLTISSCRDRPAA